MTFKLMKALLIGVWPWQKERNFFLSLPRQNSRINKILKNYSFSERVPSALFSNTPKAKLP